MKIKVDASAPTKRFLAGVGQRLSARQIGDAILSSLDGAAGFAGQRIGGDVLSGPNARRKSGALARTLGGRGVRIGGVPGFQIGTIRVGEDARALEYARVQLGDEDTTIKPRTAKALAIPVDPALKTGGVGVNYGVGPREYGKTTPLQAIYFGGAKRIGGVSADGSRRNVRSVGGDRNVIGALYRERDLAALVKRTDSRGNRRNDRRVGRGLRRVGGPAKRVRSLRDIQAVYLLVKQTTVKASRLLSTGVERELPGMVKRLESDLGAYLNRALNEA